MAFCRKCGTELSVGVSFCKHCGAPQTATKTIPSFSEAGTEGEFDDEVGFYEDDDVEIEDGDVDTAKGLDPNRSYVMRFGGRSAELYNDWGQLIRRYNMRTNVIQATTNGETVTIVTDDGWTHLYRWDGQFIRRFH